jgi:hypothetical protein
MIGSQIECLNIKRTYLSFSLEYFPNLKSIIISSPFGLPDEELKSIVKSDQFQNLHSFKIKENKAQRFNEDSNNLLTYEYNIFKKVFNRNNSLKIFQYSMITSEFSLRNRNYYGTNLNLHSLTLWLDDFRQIFSLISYALNLKYLNVRAQRCYVGRIPSNKIHIKLEQFHLTLKEKPYYIGIDFDQLINYIKRFSSSLTCLSLNLAATHMENIDEIPFNGRELQRFLESMAELEQLHLYVRLDCSSINYSMFLSQFKKQFWFDHNWSFGMHGHFLYTLPFHFDYLYGHCGDFDNVVSNNPEILINNPRIWYNVKSIEWFVPSNYDIDFVEKLKMKMPNLTLIKFKDSRSSATREAVDLLMINDEREKINLRLNNVTTIECTDGDIEDQKNWIINSLPSLRHLILRDTKLLLIDTIAGELAPLLNEKIQRLDLYGTSQFKQLTEINYVYFSNVQHINISLYDPSLGLEWYTDVMKTLTNFKKLKTLLIYIPRSRYMRVYVVAELRKLIKYLDMNGIIKNYEVKHCQGYCLFLKQEFSDNEVENGVYLTLRKSSFFSKLIRFFSQKRRS